MAAIGVIREGRRRVLSEHWSPRIAKSWADRTAEYSSEAPLVRSTTPNLGSEAQKPGRRFSRERAPAESQPSARNALSTLFKDIRLSKAERDGGNTEEIADGSSLHPFKKKILDDGKRVAVPALIRVSEQGSILPHSPILRESKMGQFESRTYTQSDKSSSVVNSLFSRGRWLRDICPCAQCRHPDTAQRQVNVFRIKSEAVEVVEIDPTEWPSTLRVKFADGHESIFSGPIIDGPRSELTVGRREAMVEPKTWTSEISDSPPEVSYAEVRAGTEGMAALLLKIRTYGFCFVNDMPATPEASEQLLQSIGPIRNTHYGGFYDFTSDLSSKDTAYTSEALEPHTDNTYFTEPAGLQALHMLSHTDGSGGESSLVDGFAAADRLFKEDREAYKTLSSTGVYAHASGNDGISIQPSQAFPTFTHSNAYGKLIQVRWNNADRAGLANVRDSLNTWYDAAGKFDALLNDPKNQYWFQLKPGRMLLFDNWRVLHGRAAFIGKRRMCGGYINRDDWISRFRMTNYTKEELESSTVTG